MVPLISPNFGLTLKKFDLEDRKVSRIHCGDYCVGVQFNSRHFVIRIYLKERDWTTKFLLRNLRGQLEKFSFRLTGN